MGLLIGVGNTKPIFPYDYYYGIEWDTNIANPACTRIGNMGFHVSLPIQSKMRRCLLLDDGTVNYYLHPNDSTKKEDGTAANLDGTDGQVMVEIPEHYRKFEVDGTINRCFISQQELSGFHFVPLCYRSAYEAAIDRTVSSKLKLCSVVNTAPEFRGGNNTTTWDGIYRSLLGRPCTNISLNEFRSYARNRGTTGKNGAGWNCDVYEIQKSCYWLYVVEYANFNCQLEYNAQPDANGYKQGGLGEGVTTINNSLWNQFNGANPFVPCGHTNSLGNRTGVVDFVMPAEYGETLTVQVPSYRGLENLFGHVWNKVDGCLCNIKSNSSGGVSEFYVNTDPTMYNNDYHYQGGYELRGLLARVFGYIKDLIIGEHGENMPKVCGGSSTTYFCDNCDAPNPIKDYQRRVMFGGCAFNGASAGLVFVDLYEGSNTSHTHRGSRLCFIPE
jgi:hypothetical protein